MAFVEHDPVQFVRDMQAVQEILKLLPQGLLSCSYDKWAGMWLIRVEIRCPDVSFYVCCDMRLVQIRNKAAAASEIIPEMFIGRTKLIANQIDLVVVYTVSHILYEIVTINQFISSPL